MHLSDFLSEPSHRPPAVSHPSGFHSLRIGFKFHHFSQEAHLFLYNLANITRGKLSYSSGGQPEKIEKNIVGVHLCLPLHRDGGCHPPYLHKVQSPLTLAIVSWHCLWTLLRKDEYQKSWFCKPHGIKQSNFTGQLVLRDFFVLQEIQFTSWNWMDTKAVINTWEQRRAPHNRTEILCIRYRPKYGLEGEDINQLQTGTVDVYVWRITQLT